jgi:hypothetical protein
MRRIFWGLGMGALLAGSATAAEVVTTAKLGGWGVDALLSCSIPESDVPGYLVLLQDAGITVARERGTGDPRNPNERDTRRTYDLTRAAGVGVVAFGYDLRGLPGTAWGGFPGDLLAVHEEARRIGRTFAEHVNAWELHNEPELAWWRDMPDLYCAQAKAIYMGLKAGAREAGHDTPVLFGSLGLPAGPWLERAARNGVLDYADAWNVHYYGDASQFTGLLNGHVAAMRELGETRSVTTVTRGSRWPVRGAAKTEKVETWQPGRVMPIWATEVGIRTVNKETWADAGRRARQSEFIVSTARQALAHPLVAAFMPFVLIYPNDGYSMTETAQRVWPAWTDYARLTRENPWPEREAVAPPHAVNPVVLQWMADEKTATGHKLAAAYRWRAEGAPIRGELRVYNLGGQPVRGRLSATRGSERTVRAGGHERAVSLPKAEEFTVAAGSVVTMPLAFALEDAQKDGWREWRQFTFEETNGRRSELGFALERNPEIFPPSAEPVEPFAWGEAKPTTRYLPMAVEGEKRDDWRVVNGVRVVARRGAMTRFEVLAPTDDPEMPKLAAMRVPEGLPPRGWLRVAMRELSQQEVRVRVDLVDVQGRRFTIWENLGHVLGARVDAPRWLALEDFHPYAWGFLDAQRSLRPEEVRELHLRFYAKQGPAMVDIEIGLATQPGRERAAQASSLINEVTRPSIENAPVE